MTSIDKIALILLIVEDCLVSMCIIGWLIIKAWKIWTNVTRTTIWFFDYKRHRLEFGRWLKEKK